MDTFGRSYQRNQKQMTNPKFTHTKTHTTHTEWTLVPRVMDGSFRHQFVDLESTVRIGLIQAAIDTLSEEERSELKVVENSRWFHMQQQLAKYEEMQEAAHDKLDKSYLDVGCRSHTSVPDRIHRLVKRHYKDIDSEQTRYYTLQDSSESEIRILRAQVDELTAAVKCKDNTITELKNELDGYGYDWR